MGSIALALCCGSRGAGRNEVSLHQVGDALSAVGVDHLRSLMHPCVSLEMGFLQELSVHATVVSCPYDQAVVARLSLVTLSGRTPVLIGRLIRREAIDSLTAHAASEPQRERKASITAWR